MNKRNEPRPLPRLPFFLADVVFLALAYVVFYRHGSGPLGPWDICWLLVFVTCACLFSVAPFVIEYISSVKLVESSGLASTVREIRNLELIAVQINAATARWQVVQEHSAASVSAAKEIADKMASEAQAFTDFLAKTNDTDKSNLRLEVEKLRRVENEWLQIIVRMLDHTYALHRAAERSGQPGLIEQLGRFQSSCRDVARRIGLVPFEPGANELYDPQWHRLPEPDAKVVPGAKIHDILASGYTYQGRMLRPALVALKSHEQQTTGNGVEVENGQSEAAQESAVEKTLL